MKLQRKGVLTLLEISLIMAIYQTQDVGQWQAGDPDERFFGERHRVSMARLPYGIAIVL